MPTDSSLTFLQCIHIKLGTGEIDMPIFTPARCMNKRVRITGENEEDRISKLPDDVIHRILKFLDTKSALQTTILSKRNDGSLFGLPCLFSNSEWNFPSTENKSISKFTPHVLKHRQHRSWILHLTFEYLTPALFARFVNYAIFVIACCSTSQS